MDMNHLHNLSHTELLTEIEAHPCFWDSSPAAIFMKELHRRHTELIDQVIYLQAQVKDLESDLESIGSQ